jgi:V8-like Glu-specific endopeptidase
VFAAVSSGARATDRHRARDIAGDGRPAVPPPQLLDATVMEGDGAGITTRRRLDFARSCRKRVLKSALRQRGNTPDQICRQESAHLQRTALSPRRRGASGAPWRSWPRERAAASGAASCAHRTSRAEPVHELQVIDRRSFMRSNIVALCAIATIALTACAADIELTSALDDVHPSERDVVDLGEYPPEPVDKVYHGDTVTGAGDRGQWEGIVQIVNRWSTGDDWSCTGFFITDRHIVTSGHCFESQGSRTVRLSAPTWNGGTPQSHFVWVNRQGSSRSIDVAIVQLAGPVAWATSARRFRLYTGPTVMRTMLNIYGYGANNHAGGGVGTLRTGENGSRVRVIDQGDGYFKAEAREARICGGDSGGPALREGTKAVVWGIASQIEYQGNNECPSPEQAMTWTKINSNLDYIERAIGFTCDRYSADDQTYARCW